MSKLEKAKEIVKAYYREADCGIFNSRNVVGDWMETIYKGEGLTIDICYSYAYFEVFGLSNTDFEKLEKYYSSLGRKKKDIELVITIHEDSYKATCNGCMLPPDVENVVNAIANGTPLSNIKEDIITRIGQTRDKDKLCEYPYNRCIDIVKEACDGY